MCLSMQKEVLNFNQHLFSESVFSPQTTCTFSGSEAPLLQCSTALLVRHEPRTRIDLFIGLLRAKGWEIFIVEVLPRHEIIIA